MSKIRTIKPEFWIDSDIASLDVWSRLFFIGLLNFADDEGVFEWKPKQLKVQVFPYDDIDVEKLFNELLSIGRIKIFTDKNKDYGIITNFNKHQRIDDRYKKVLIEGLDKAKLTYHAGTTCGPVFSLVGREGKGGGGEVEGEGNILFSNENMSDHEKIIDPEEIEFKKFVLLASKVLGQGKLFTAEGFKKWKARRKNFSSIEIAESFANIVNEPGQWKINNVGYQSLAWWLKSDEYLRELQNCHLKAGPAGSVFVS